MAEIGALLSQDELLHVISEPDQPIFVHGSWDAEHIEGAGYALRLADRWLVVPKARIDGTRHHEVVDGGASRLEFTLAPGETAVVATEERWALTPEYTAQIGPKFRLAARGLLLVHGMVAHPCFGRRLVDGAWVPEEDRRLQLIVVNLGSKPIELQHQKTIAYAQFFRVAPSPTNIDLSGFDWLEENFFAGTAAPLGAIAYKTDLADVSEQMGERDAGLESRLSTIEGDVADHVASLERQMDRIQNTTMNVVVFGVFLIASVLFGLVVEGLSSVVLRLPALDQLEPYQGWTLGITVLLYVGAVVLIALVFLGRLSKGLKSRSGRARTTKAEEGAKAQGAQE